MLFEAETFWPKVWRLAYAPERLDKLVQIDLLTCSGPGVSRHDSCTEVMFPRK